MEAPLTVLCLLYVWAGVIVIFCTAGFVNLMRGAIELALIARVEAAITIVVAFAWIALVASYSKAVFMWLGSFEIGCYL